MKKNYLISLLLISGVSALAQTVSFTSSSFGSGTSISCVADMNNDHLDDIVAVQSTQMRIYKQKSSGGFDLQTITFPTTVSAPNWSIAAGDFDKNGYNDLALGNGSRVSILKANADGTDYTIVAYPENIFTQRTNFVDINNDGDLDLWACHDVAQSHAYRNDGTGNLLFDISLMPTLAVGGNYQSMWTDYNNDGLVDMYLAKCRGGAPVGDPQRINLLYKNNGDGTFSEVGAAAGVNDGAQSWSTAIEDFDNDGDFDFLLSNISDSNRLYRNNGDGTFTDVYATSGIASQVGSWELQAADFNNDGFVDFLWENSKELYLNNGNMTFTGYDMPVSDGAIGDLNNDGFLDVVSGSNVYYNNANSNHWSKVKLTGTTSNRNGIGAKVELYGAWGKQIREIRSGQGFSHMSNMDANFGIGTATVIEKIIVRWPSGIVDTYMNPNTDETTYIIEGSTVLGLDNFASADLNVYPNPAQDVLHIKFNNPATIIVSASVYDLSGRLISDNNALNQTIEVKTIASGSYVLVIKDNHGKVYSKKFLKK